MNPIPFDDDQLQRVAALYCEGMGKHEIAEILFISEDDTEHMIEAAAQKSYFRFKPTLTSKGLSPETQEFVTNEVLTSALNACLRRKLECTLTPITITPSHHSMFTKFAISPEESTKDFEEYLKAERNSVQRTAERAAQKLSAALFDGKDHTIGLNWGAIVGETIQKIHPLPSRMNGARGSVIPNSYRRRPCTAATGSLPPAGNDGTQRAWGTPACMRRARKAGRGLGVKTRARSMPVRRSRRVAAMAPCS